ncbi:peptide ABC transporter substrate-binding protein [Secundilactobacillus odoratitofui]|nr:peptide ABC transporter substrate-binding protein [Secundilactobacillus odoratitofui]
MKSKLGLLGLLVMLTTLTACTSQLANSNKTSDSKGIMSQNQTVTITEQSPLSTVDISKVASFTKLRSSTEGLFRLGKNSHVNAGLAKSYTVSKNAKVYTFNLRQNARWSDGEPITASDFVYSWQRSVAPKTRSVNAGLFTGIKNATQVRKGTLPVSKLGVKALSKHRLQVTLSHPIVYFETLLAYPLFAPQHKAMVDRYGNRYGMSADTQLYSGPFKLVHWKADSKTRTLVPNPYYWDKAHVYLKRLTITTQKSPAASLKAFNAGKIAETQLIGAQIPANEDRTDYVVRPFSLMRDINYNFNTANKSAKQLINNRNARLAISHAIDRKLLINTALQNASLPPKGFVTVGLSKNNLTHSDFADQQRGTSYVKGNPSVAKQEWQLACNQLKQSRFTLTLTIPNDLVSLKVGTNIKQQLMKRLNGLTINLNTIPSKQLTKQATQGHYELLLSGWGADYPDPLTFLQIMTDNSRHNYGHWQNQTYNELVDQISDSQNGNAQTRWEQMLTAEKLLMTQQAITPLYQQADSYLTDAKLNGVVHNISGVVNDYKSAYMVK